MIVLDTTVLLHAVGRDSPFRAGSRRLVAAAADPALRITTTVEVIQEAAHVRARRHGRDDAVSLARDYVVGLSPLLVPDVDDLLAGLDLFRTLPELGAFDAVLAAAARSQGADALVSADQAFAGVPGIRHVVPVDDSVDMLLA